MESEFCMGVIALQFGDRQWREPFLFLSCEFDSHDDFDSSNQYYTVLPGVAYPADSVR